MGEKEIGSAATLIFREVTPFVALTDWLPLGVMGSIHNCGFRDFAAHHLNFSISEYNANII